MANTEVKLSVRFAWWLKPYLRVLAFCCIVAGTAKRARKIRSAARVIVE